jgi:hypothetical protein
VKQIIMALGLVLLAAPAFAQYYGYTAPQLRQPTTIRPIPFGGGYTVNTPGQMPTTVRPIPFGGGYTINTPGQQPTRCRPIPFGGGVTCQ